MSRKLFLYYIFDANKKPMFVNKFGYVQQGNEDLKNSDGEPVYLKDSPTGWTEALVKYARNIKYWGVFRDLTVPMQFPGDGMKILRHLMWNGKGVEAVAHLAIFKLEQHSLPYEYKPWYVSEINFAKFNDSLTGFQVEALEGGLTKYLKAYENTVYEIPVDTDPEHVTVLMDGKEIDNTATWAILNGAGDYNRGSHTVNVMLVQKEVEEVGGVFDVERYVTPNGNNNADLHNAAKYFFKSTANGVLKVEWDYELTITYYEPPAINPAAVIYTQIRVLDANGNFKSGTQTLNFPWQFGVTRRHQGTADIAVAEGDELYLFSYATVHGASGDANIEWLYGGSEPFLKATYTYRFPSSYVKGLPPFTLFKRIMERMAPGYTGRSGYLQDLWDKIIITSGDALRGNTGSVIKTSFASFFKTFASRGAGAGVEGAELVIEGIKYFFQDEVMMDLGDVIEATIEPAEDLVYNTFEGGYAPQTYENINGVFEFNQGISGTLPVTRIVKNLDLKSEYRADAFGAELLRINFGAKKSTDSKADNDTFMLSVATEPTHYDVTGGFGLLEGFDGGYIAFGFTVGLPPFAAGQTIAITGTASNDGVWTVVDVIKVGFVSLVLITSSLMPVVPEDAVAMHVEILTGSQYYLRREAYTNVQGLLHPETEFNIELSPKRALLLNGELLHSILDRQETESIVITAKDKNPNMSTTLNGVTIDERAPVKVGSLPPKLFQPYYINLKTKVPVNLLQIVGNNPYRKVQFWWRGKAYFGYLFDGSIKPGTNEAVTWKLLSAPENNLIKFNG